VEGVERKAVQVAEDSKLGTPNHEKGVGRWPKMSRLEREQTDGEIYVRGRGKGKPSFGFSAIARH
jgi:hypothetical protein